MKDVVIISKSCPFSMQFLGEMEKLPIASQFLYFQSDPDPQTGKQNIQLLKILDVKRTPTVYHQGNKYEGKAAFQWLSSVMQSINNGRQQQAPQQQNQYNQQYNEPVNGVMRLPIPQVTTPRASALQQPPPSTQQIPQRYSSAGASGMQREEPVQEFAPVSGGMGGGLENFAAFDENFVENPEAMARLDGHGQRGSNMGDIPQLSRTAGVATKERDQLIGGTDTEQLLRDYERQRESMIPQSVQRQ